VLTSLTFALAACGSDAATSEDATVLTAATTGVRTTDASTAPPTAPPTASSATTSPPTTERTTTDAPTTSPTTEPPADEPLIVLRGDGLGDLDFGSSQADVMAALTDLLGAPSGDSGPPSQMATPLLNGCGYEAEWAGAFGPGVVVGFDDEGSGLVLTSWSAFHNGHGLGEVRTDFATVDGFWVGADLSDAERIYGERFRWKPASGWLWPVLDPVAAVESEGGTIGLVDLFHDGHADLLTAGVGCGPTGELPEPLGEYPLGLRYVTQIPPAADAGALATLVDADSGEETGWETFGGGCVGECQALIDIVAEAGTGAPAFLWAARAVEYRGGRPVLVVTDTMPIPADLQPFGNWDCAPLFPLIDTSGAVAMLLDVDPVTGKFAELAPDAVPCTEIMGD